MSNQYALQVICGAGQHINAGDYFLKGVSENDFQVAL
jgi:hypothetical protein